MRYFALDVFTFLLRNDCEFAEERHPCGQIWLSRTLQVFMLPDPDVDEDGVTWFDADVIDDILKDRWLGPVEGLRRYPDKGRLSELIKGP